MSFYTDAETTEINELIAKIRDRIATAGSATREAGEKLLQTAEAELKSGAGDVGAVLEKLTVFLFTVAFDEDPAADEEPSEEWAAVVYNDDSVTFGQAIDALSVGADLSASVAANLAFEIDANGSGHAFTGARDDAFKVAQKLNTAGLSTGVQKIS